MIFFVAFRTNQLTPLCRESLPQKKRSLVQAKSRLLKRLQEADGRRTKLAFSQDVGLIIGLCVVTGLLHHKHFVLAGVVPAGHPAVPYFTWEVLQ